MNTHSRTNTIARAVVLVKETQFAYLQRTNDQVALDKIAQGSEGMDKIAKADEEHRHTLDVVSSELTRRRIAFDIRQREPGAPYDPDGDLVIAIGGDGTFLDASHYIMSNVPILGVNSAPSTSHGHYCLTDADDFSPILDEIISGQRKTHPLLRLGLYKDGQLLPKPVLNEVLITDESPGGTSRYIVHFDGQSCEQMSAGLIVSTSSGSTGTMCCAPPGLILPITGDQMQFRTREPNRHLVATMTLLWGLFKRGQEIRVVSKMPTGKLIIDGKYIVFDFPRGSEVIVKAHPLDLNAYIDPDLHDAY